MITKNRKKKCTPTKISSSSPTSISTPASVKSNNPKNLVLPNFLLEHPKDKPNPKNFIPNKWPKLTAMVCYSYHPGKQTPKGPNYDITDKFSYVKGAEWKIGTQPRNTLDTKAKYEHYFRKDIDVFLFLFRLTSMRLIGEIESILAIRDLAVLPGFPWRKKNTK